MAELAAKIRAKFRRRHSAVPGIPSLLSRTSIRSSSGSHGSSLFRPLSHGYTSRSSTNNDPDPDRTDGEDESRIGSSRVSVNDDDAKDDRESADQSKDTTTTTVTSNDSMLAQNGDSLIAESQGGEAVTAVAKVAELADGDVVTRAGDGNETFTAQEAAHAHNEQLQAQRHMNDGSTETFSIDSISASPAAAVSKPTSCSEPSHSSALGSSTIPVRIPGPQQPSDMSGKDRHSSPRKLSIVSELSTPGDLPSLDDNLADSVPVYSDQPLPPQPTSAPAADQQSVNDLIPPSTAPAVPPAPLGTAVAVAVAVAAASTLPKKRNDASLRPMRTVPRTPNLGPATPSRPLHIHLPPASFGGPNPNLSPGGAISSYTSHTAPTSPLRHSTLAPPPAPTRRKSLLANRQTTLIQTLLRATQAEGPATPNVGDPLLSINGNMVTRKIWVKRPGASATLVTINEDDLVDDVRDMILKKYANSLGRQFDAPDLTLRIRPNGNQQERMLGPDEPMSRTLDVYFPSGQTVEDALVIDTPLRRTPRASPRVGPPHAPHIQYYVEDPRPPETAGDYFGPAAISALPVTVTAPPASSGQSHAISVLSTGQVPQIPSPGGRRARDYRERPERPRLGRQHTSSPTLINLASGAAHPAPTVSAVIPPHDISQAAPQPPIALPTPPTAEPASAVPQRIATPPPRAASPRLKKSKKKTDHPQLPKGMLNGTVPPINVLIVEDNIINLKLLEAFVKRLKVRWSTAMNGRDAVLKWRGGGFHLVLMDIQLPIMSGLDATREIRRLERVNSIGVFSSAAASAPVEAKGEPAEKDRLENKDLFKSPVIIVALTASSLQSDRHEALAAGCNDFLTKPVNFVWLERKVMEWGCMQALIDFDGWRQWKDFSAQQVDDRAKAAAALKAKSKRNRSSLTLGAVAAGA